MWWKVLKQRLGTTALGEGLAKFLPCLHEETDTHPTLCDVMWSDPGKEDRIHPNDKGVMEKILVPQRVCGWK